MSTTRRRMSGSRLNNASATLDIATNTTQEAISQWGMVRKRTALGIGLNMAWQQGANASYANTHSYGCTKAPLFISCHCRYMVIRSQMLEVLPGRTSQFTVRPFGGLLNVVSSRCRLSRGECGNRGCLKRLIKQKDPMRDLRQKGSSEGPALGFASRPG